MVGGKVVYRANFGVSLFVLCTKPTSLWVVYETREMKSNLISQLFKIEECYGCACASKSDASCHAGDDGGVGRRYLLY